MLLTDKNYKDGFLVNDQFIAGISCDEGKFVAYVLSQESGQYIHYGQFQELVPALTFLNTLSFAWEFESTSSCGSGNCGGSRCGDKCKGTSCKLF